MYALFRRFGLFGHIIFHWFPLTRMGLAAFFWLLIVIFELAPSWEGDGIMGSFASAISNRIWLLFRTIQTKLPSMG